METVNFVVDFVKNNAWDAAVEVAEEAGPMAVTYLAIKKARATARAIVALGAVLFSASVAVVAFATSMSLYQTAILCGWFFGVAVVIGFALDHVFKIAEAWACYRVISTALKTVRKRHWARPEANVPRVLACLSFLWGLTEVREFIPLLSVLTAFRDCALSDFGSLVGWFRSILQLPDFMGLTAAPALLYGKWTCAARGRAWWALLRDRLGDLYEYADSRIRSAICAILLPIFYFKLGMPKVDKRLVKPLLLGCALDGLAIGVSLVAVAKIITLLRKPNATPTSGPATDSENRLCGAASTGDGVDLSAHAPLQPERRGGKKAKKRQLNKLAAKQLSRDLSSYRAKRSDALANYEYEVAFADGSKRVMRYEDLELFCNSSSNLFVRGRQVGDAGGADSQNVVFINGKMHLMSDDDYDTFQMDRWNERVFGESSLYALPESATASPVLDTSSMDKKLVIMSSDGAEVGKGFFYRGNLVTTKHVADVSDSYWTSREGIKPLPGVWKFEGEVATMRVNGPSICKTAVAPSVGQTATLPTWQSIRLGEVTGVGNRIHHDCSTQPGDSGSPVLVWDNGAFRLIGVHYGAGNGHNVCDRVPEHFLR